MNVNKLIKFDVINTKTKVQHGKDYIYRTVTAWTKPNEVTPYIETSVALNSTKTQKHISNLKRFENGDQFITSTNISPDGRKDIYKTYIKTGSNDIFSKLVTFSPEQ